MKRYQVLGGNHCDDDGRLYSKGDVVVTELPLDKLFVNKFKRLGKSRKDKKGKKKDKGKRAKKIAVSVAVQTGSGTKPAEARGKDVTSEFESVGKEGLKVFRRGLYYHVYDGDATTPINDKGLKKDKVEEFATAHLEA